jgi:hypothetical protein
VRKEQPFHLIAVLIGFLILMLLQVDVQAVAGCVSTSGNTRLLLSGPRHKAGKAQLTGQERSRAG